MKRPIHKVIAALDPECAAYADLVAGRLKTVLGDNLVGVYLHGSLVLGDFSRERSDIDIMAVSDRHLSPEEKRAVADQLSSASLPCPVGELEFHIVDSDGLGGSLAAPPFELHIATDRSGVPDRVVDGQGHVGDPDLVMHFAVLREYGHALSGPRAAEIFPRIPHERLVRAFADELRWAEENASPTYQLLNACRAWRFLEEGVLCSKTEGGEWARSHMEEPALVDVAIDHRRGQTEIHPDGPKVRALLQEVLRRLGT